jgi:hypothetical protein
MTATAAHIQNDGIAAVDKTAGSSLIETTSTSACNNGALLTHGGFLASWSWFQIIVPPFGITA